MNEHGSIIKLNRALMLQEKTKTSFQQQEAPCLILNYNSQHKDVTKVINWHWHILRNKDLQKFLPDKPQIIYKRAPTLKDLIVKSVIEPPLKASYSFFTKKRLLSVQTLLRLPAVTKKEWNS